MLQPLWTCDAAADEDGGDGGEFAAVGGAWLTMRIPRSRLMRWRIARRGCCWRDACWPHLLVAPAAAVMRTGSPVKEAVVVSEDQSGDDTAAGGTGYKLKTQYKEISMQGDTTTTEYTSILQYNIMNSISIKRNQVKAIFKIQ